MGNRRKKTMDMLVHNIQWTDVAEDLNITIRTLLDWRTSGDTNKNEAIDYSIQRIKLKEVQNE